MYNPILTVLYTVEKPDFDLKQQYILNTRLSVYIVYLTLTFMMQHKHVKKIKLINTHHLTIASIIYTECF